MPVEGTPLYEEQIGFAKEEEKRRRSSPVHVKGDDVAALLAKNSPLRHPLYIVDPRIGFNNRTHRFWLHQLPAGGEDGQKWKKLGHRHTVEAVIYYLSGRGCSIIDGVRHDWEPGDLVCVPMFAWHRHINESDEPATYLASTTGPLSMGTGLAVYEDENYPEQWVYATGTEEDRKTLVPGGTPDVQGLGDTSLSSHIYAEQVRFAGLEEEKRRASRVLVKPRDLLFGNTPMGKVAYAVDRATGFHVKALSTAVAEIEPGSRSGAHRHLYDEIDYILEGEGRAIVDDQVYEIKKGDTLAIPVFAWHQYFSTGDVPLRILAHSTRPAMENLGLMATQQGEAAPLSAP